MIIYSGATVGASREEYYSKYNLGIMISSTRTRYPSPYFTNYRCALDNGAFSQFRSGYPFQEIVFLDCMAKCYEMKIKLDFIVCPDIVAGGKKSLDFSMRWTDRLICDNLALVVQDGMEPSDLSTNILEKFAVIFVGGSKAWKWDTAEQWVDFAHHHGKLCHIGQAGTLNALRNAQKYQADSVDSTSWAVNRSWHILEEFTNPKQRRLF